MQNKRAQASWLFDKVFKFCAVLVSFCAKRITCVTAFVVGGLNF